MTKTSGGVEITARDIELLKMAFEYKVIDRQGVGEYIFKGLHPTITERRLQKFCEAKILKRISYIGGKKAKTAYTLTQMGLTKTIPFLPHVPDRNQVNSACVSHDLELLRIGERFRSSHLVTEYRTENILQSSKDFREGKRYWPFYEIHSDAMAAIEIQNREFLMAIEYESTAKADNRWEEKLYNYHFEEGIKAVLYICPDAKMTEKLHQLGKSAGHRFGPKLHTILLKDFFSNGSVAIFKNVQGQEFSLKFRN